MREITIELTDYDVVADNINTFIGKLYLLAPIIVFSHDQIGMNFYY